MHRHNIIHKKFIIYWINCNFSRNSYLKPSKKVFIEILFKNILLKLEKHMINLFVKKYFLWVKNKSVMKFPIKEIVVLCENDQFHQLYMYNT